MSGVIDEHGQWEHCNGCGRFVLIQDLKTEKPSAEFKHGRDLCTRCFNGHIATREEVLEQATHHVRAVGKPRYVFQTATDKWVHMDAKSHDRFPQDGDHNFTLVILEP